MDRLNTHFSHLQISPASCHNQQPDLHISNHIKSRAEIQEQLESFFHKQHGSLPVYDQAGLRHAVAGLATGGCAFERLDAGEVLQELMHKYGFRNDGGLQALRHSLLNSLVRSPDHPVPSRRIFWNAGPIKQLSANNVHQKERIAESFENGKKPAALHATSTRIQKRQEPQAAAPKKAPATQGETADVRMKALKAKKILRRQHAIHVSALSREARRQMMREMIREKSEEFWEDLQTDLYDLSAESSSSSPRIHLHQEEDVDDSPQTDRAPRQCNR